MRPLRPADTPASINIPYSTIPSNLVPATQANVAYRLHPVLRSCGAARSTIRCVPHVAHRVLRRPVLICELQVVERALFRKNHHFRCGVEHMQQQVWGLSTSNSKQPFGSCLDVKPATEANARPILTIFRVNSARAPAFPAMMHCWEVAALPVLQGNASNSRRSERKSLVSTVSANHSSLKLELAAKFWAKPSCSSLTVPSFAQVKQHDDPHDAIYCYSRQLT